MSFFLKTLALFSFIMIVFNLTKLNWDNPLNENSIIALIGILASSSSLLLLIIFIISKKIFFKIKD
tara:strand:- start:2083 stop:2280 length:198 start_codon:yes stop_codon:yes gene_type:complete